MLENAITAWIGDVIHYLNAGNVRYAQLRGQMLQADLERLHRSAGNIIGTDYIDHDLITELGIHIARGLDKLGSGGQVDSALLSFNCALHLWHKTVQFRCEKRPRV